MSLPTPPEPTKPGFAQRCTVNVQVRLQREGIDQCGRAGLLCEAVVKPKLPALRAQSVGYGGRKTVRRRGRSRAVLANAAVGGREEADRQNAVLEAAFGLGKSLGSVVAG